MEKERGRRSLAERNAIYCVVCILTGVRIDDSAGESRLAVRQRELGPLRLPALRPTGTVLRKSSRPIGGVQETRYVIERPGPRWQFVERVFACWPAGHRSLRVKLRKPI